MISFTFSTLSIDPEGVALFNEELKAAHPTVDHTYIHDDTLEVHFDGSEVQADIDATTAWVNAYDSNDLDHQKVEKNAGIDLRTQELILGGAAYDGETFSLSANAQRNWIATFAAISIYEATSAWPVTVTTADDKAYDLVDAAAATNFAAAMLSAAAAPYNSGRDLKIAVNAATTQAELDAVVDNR